MPFRKKVRFYLTESVKCVLFTYKLFLHSMYLLDTFQIATLCTRNFNVLMYSEVVDTDLCSVLEVSGSFTPSTAIRQSGTQATGENMAVSKGLLLLQYQIKAKRANYLD